MTQSINRALKKPGRTTKTTTRRYRAVLSSFRPRKKHVEPTIDSSRAVVKSQIKAHRPPSLKQESPGMSEHRPIEKTRQRSPLFEPTTRTASASVGNTTIIKTCARNSTFMARPILIVLLGFGIDLTIRMRILPRPTHRVRKRTCRDRIACMSPSDSSLAKTAFSKTKLISSQTTMIGDSRAQQVIETEVKNTRRS
jgi:hypothetical protein